MTAVGPEFYDRALCDPKSPSLAPLDERHPYWTLYVAAASLVPEGSSVVELGCGTGRFADLIRNRVGEYVGIDFSERAVREAVWYASGELGIDFFVGDLRTCEIPEADVYVALEVLEHLDDDLALLERIPAGATVVLSVPSFNSASHVRTFPTMNAAADRYSKALDVAEVQYVHTAKRGAFFHLLRGAKR